MEGWSDHVLWEPSGYRRGSKKLLVQNGNKDLVNSVTKASHGAGESFKSRKYDFRLFFKFHPVASAPILKVWRTTFKSKVPMLINPGYPCPFFHLCIKTLGSRKVHP